MTDLHQPSDTTTALGSADGGAAKHRFRGPSYEQALATAMSELGDGIRVVEASRIRRGGLGGFFATDLGVEIAVVADERADGEFSAEVMQLADGGMEGLLAEIERAERESVRNVGESVAPVDDSTPASFADHLADAESSDGEVHPHAGMSDLDDARSAVTRSMDDRRSVRPRSAKTGPGVGQSARSGPGSRFELDLADGEQQTEVVDAERRRALTARRLPETEATEPSEATEIRESTRRPESVAVETSSRLDDDVVAGLETSEADGTDESMDELDALLRRAGVTLPGDVEETSTAVEVMPDASTAPSTAIVPTTSVELVAQTTDRLLSRLAAVVPAQGSCLDDLTTIRVTVTTPDGTKVEMSAESGRRRD